MGLSRPEFAKLLGLNGRTVVRWEDGWECGGAGATIAETLETWLGKAPENAQLLRALASSSVRADGLNHFLTRLLDALALASRIHT